MTCLVSGCDYPAGTRCTMQDCPGRKFNTPAALPPTSRGQRGEGVASGPCTGATPELILTNHAAEVAQ